MSPSQLRLFRLAGIGVCCTLLLLRSLLLLQHGMFLREMAHAGWLLPMAVFAMALWHATSGKSHGEWTAPLLLFVQSASVLTMAFTMGRQGAANYLGYLLLIVTIEIALTLPTHVVIPWILVQTSILALSYRLVDNTDNTTAAVSILFKLFTYAIVVGLKREADTRLNLSKLHAEMIASRELHAERSRHHERLRISRDLHDVLGHRLAALSLNLEIAAHSASPEREIQHAQILCRELLRDVREVVSVTRPTEIIDLHAALSRIAESFAPMEIHIEVPDDLCRCDASRGEVLIRCAQELITNAVKHARARHVWITFALQSDQVLHLRSHDDGVAVPVGAGGGTGLVSMRERFEAFGGSIQAHNHPEEGFVIEGSLPMKVAYA